jgi:hypothetical protein
MAAYFLFYFLLPAAKALPLPVVRRMNYTFSIRYGLPYGGLIAAACAPLLWQDCRLAW